MKSPRFIDYLTIVLWAASSILLVLASSGPDDIGRIYLHTDSSVLDLWMSSIFTISTTLLVGLALWREPKLPKLYRILPSILFALIIVCACIRPYTASNGSGSFMVVVWAGVPHFLMFYPISIVTSIVLTLTAWGSLRTLLISARPLFLTRLAFVTPALYVLFVLIIAAQWFSFAHALLNGPSLF